MGTYKDKLQLQLMLEGSFFHFPSLEMKMILSSFSPKHPKGELDHVWDIQPNVFVAESPSQHTTGNQHNPVLFAMWTDFNLDALRTLILFFLTKPFRAVQWVNEDILIFPLA